MKDRVSNDTVFAFAVIAATLFTIIFNGLAATGWLNGVTAGEVSAKYPTILTPAGYAFSIWSLIYFGLSIFSIIQVLPANLERFRRVRIPYLVSCLMNCMWLYLWHHEYLLACAFTIILLAALIIFILRLLPDPATYIEAAFTTGVFGVYAGWVTCASLVNVFIFFTARGMDPANLFFGIAAVVTAVGAAFIVRWRLRNYLYPLAVAWALGAIAVAQSGKTAIVIATVFGTVAAMVISGSVVVELKDSTSGDR